jgi:hypothetical protein
MPLFLFLASTADRHGAGCGMPASPLTETTTRPEAEGLRKSDVSAHHLDQGLQSGSFLPSINSCHEYDVREQTDVANRVRALWVRPHAPQTNYVRGRLYTIHKLGIYAPIFMVAVINNLRVIGSGAKAHFAFRRDEELAQWISVFHPIINVLYGLQITWLNG